MDFPKSDATTQEQDTRAWCVNVAVRVCLGDTVEDIIKSAEKIEEFINDNNGLTYDDGTMFKVQEALCENGYLPSDIPNVISSFQNRGIVFRERA